MQLVTRITDASHFNTIVAHISQYTVLTELEAAIIDIQATGRFGGLIRSSRFLALAESTQSRSTGSSKLDDTFDAIKAGVRPTWMIACEYLSDVSIAFKIGLRDVSDMCTSATSLTVLTHLLTKYHQIVQMSKCPNANSQNCQLTLIQRSKLELTTPTHPEVMRSATGAIGATVTSTFRSVFAKALHMNFNTQYVALRSKGISYFEMLAVGPGAYPPGPNIGYCKDRMHILEQGLQHISTISATQNSTGQPRQIQNRTISNIKFQTITNDHERSRAVTNGHATAGVPVVLDDAVEHGAYATVKGETSVTRAILR
jgi:hypothetical protein